MTEQENSLLIALENERRYVARELHDGVAQTTLQVGLQVGLCRKLLEAGKLDALASELDQLESHSQRASAQVREVIGDMRPPKVEPEAGLDAYIEHLIEVHIERGGPPITYQNDWQDDSPDFAPVQFLTMIRIIQEALLNARKHAKAEKIQLSFSVSDEAWMVTVSDDGHGFDSLEVETRSVDKGGAGIANMHARAQFLGGTLAISRNILGQGTKVALTIPK